jgi:ribosome recycling factor
LPSFEGLPNWLKQRIERAFGDGARLSGFSPHIGPFPKDEQRQALLRAAKAYAISPASGGAAAHESAARGLKGNRFIMAQQPSFDIADLKRRMQAALQSLKHELGGLRTGRASASLLEPVHVEAYGQRMALNQVATISVPEPRALSVQVWDKSMVSAVDKAIREANLGLSPTVEGQVLRIRIPELNEQRRKEMVKVAHKYAEEARVAVRHVRRDGIDILKRQLKDRLISEDDEKRHEAEVQKATDQAIHEIDQALAGKEKEIMQV